MRSWMIAVSLLTFGVPALSADIASAPHVGQVVRDANESRLGSIDRVLPDGSVRIIFESRLIVIPNATLSSTDGKIRTSLTKREVAKLN